MPESLSCINDHFCEPSWFVVGLFLFLFLSCLVLFPFLFLFLFLLFFLRGDCPLKCCMLFCFGKSINISWKINKYVVSVKFQHQVFSVTIASGIKFFYKIQISMANISFHSDLFSSGFQSSIISFDNGKHISQKIKSTPLLQLLSPNHLVCTLNYCIFDLSFCPAPSVSMWNFVILLYVQKRRQVHDDKKTVCDCYLPLGAKKKLISNQKVPAFSPLWMSFSFQNAPFAKWIFLTASDVSLAVSHLVKHALC